MMRTAAVLSLLALALSAPRVNAQKSNEWRTDFSKHTVPLDEIVSGGPPKDGIPAIDRPRFTNVRTADDWIDGREPVMVVDHGGATHIYPIYILIWHEIVNDNVGGLPVAVTYCPLCNTALVFDRRLDGKLLDFGTTGRLRHSDLVMYDRQTETWWQQATGEGIVGALAGRSLQAVPSQMLDWALARTQFPAAKVLSRETGHTRPYGRSPYAGYDRSPAPIAAFFRAGKSDDRLPAMERVVAVRLGAASVAYPFRVLREKRVANEVVEGTPIAVFWGPGAASAVDAATIAEGRDVGATGVFDRRVGTRTLSFEAAGDGRFRDRETRSVWLLTGLAAEGPLKGARLDPLPHGDYFWFAWAVFRPDTRIWR